MNNQAKIYIGIELLQYSLLSVAMILFFLGKIHHVTFLVLIGSSVILSIVSMQYEKRIKLNAEFIRKFKELSSLPLYIMPLIFFVIVSFYVYPAMWNGLSSKSWSISEGTLLNKDFHKRTFKTGGSLWSPIVEYQYSVGDKLYKNSVYSYYFFVFGKEWAQNEVKGLSINSKVAVYYNPSNPEKSCLKPGPDIWSIIYSMVSGPLILALLILTTKSIKRVLPNHGIDSDS
jgi:hypothetical protein